MKSKSTRSAMMSDSDIDTESIASVTRKNIAMWIGKQQSKLQDLKENDYFTIFVSYVRKSHDLSASVKCHACNSRTQLQRSAVNTSTFAISNWTRHIKNCSMLHSHPGSRTRPIYSYLSPPLSSSTARTSGRETFEQNSQLPLTGDNGDVASGGNEVANKPLEDSADVGPNIPNATLDTQGIAGDNHTGLLLEESVPDKVADQNQNQNESEQIFPEAPLLRRERQF